MRARPRTGSPAGRRKLRSQQPSKGPGGWQLRHGWRVAAPAPCSPAPQRVHVKMGQGSGDVATPAAPGLRGLRGTSVAQAVHGSVH